MAVSAFLPWVTATAVIIGEESAMGTEGDGMFALGIAGVVAFAFFTHERTVAIVCGIAGAILGVFERTKIANRAGTITARMEGLGTASVGIGVWLMMAAAVVILVAAFSLPRQTATAPVG